MNDSMKLPQPPKGLSRFFYRLPILFYRAGLGILLGHRFLLLEHVGRKSGLIRSTVLEVIRQDREIGAYYVVSAFGERSDWYQNVTLSPGVTITVGSKRMQAQAKLLSEDESANEIIDYAHRYKLAFRFLATRFFGYPAPKSEEDVRRIAQGLHVVCLRTTNIAQDEQR
jgi:deazaflavin-dependent oxidoreductase (nitroreductase family)